MGSGFLRRLANYSAISDIGSFGIELKPTYGRKVQLVNYSDFIKYSNGGVNKRVSHEEYNFGNFPTIFRRQHVPTMVAVAVHLSSILNPILKFG